MASVSDWVHLILKLYLPPQYYGLECQQVNESVYHITVSWDQLVYPAKYLSLFSHYYTLLQEGCLLIRLLRKLNRVFFANYMHLEFGLYWADIVQHLFHGKLISAATPRETYFSAQYWEIEKIKKWGGKKPSTRRDLNSWLLVCEACTLPLCCNRCLENNLVQFQRVNFLRCHFFSPVRTFKSSIMRRDGSLQAAAAQQCRWFSRIRKVRRPGHYRKEALAVVRW